MIAAAMPETAIDEDRDTCTSKDQVRTPTRVREGRMVNPVPKAPAMQKGSQGQLRTGVALPCRLHPPLSLRRRGRGN